MFRSVIVLIFALSAAQILSAQSFEYAVKQHRTLKIPKVVKEAEGKLTIGPNGVEYKSSKPKDSRKWRFEDIRVIEVKSPTKISLVTYEDQKRWMGKDKVFEFTLLDKTVDPELSAFLLSKVKRPMELAIIPEDAEKPAFELPVKHLGTITGAMGVLRIYSDKVVFQSSKVGDSRYWRLADIERFSQPDRYRFQIVSYLPKTGGPTEAYSFQLLEDLPEGVYDYLWVRLHPSSYYPEIRR